MCLFLNPSDSLDCLSKCSPLSLRESEVELRHVVIQLEEEKVHAASFAEAEAQASVKDEVGRILELERATTHNTLTQAVMREKVSAEDERLRTQLYAKQLELRDQELKKQDAFYREQVARLEDRSAQFYKMTTENYHKAADGINAKFKRFEVSPVCADLQGQILKCYQEHSGKTLLCSTIASRYLQCVNQAKQVGPRGGRVWVCVYLGIRMNNLLVSIPIYCNL
uniref:Coiled-coil-helix-coiled-coil-helix domain containing 3a n=1 Tax=Oncorhynchus kisutch TaxID=8019 RepID=A0A8C7K8H0_ONCKI